MKNSFNYFVDKSNIELAFQFGPNMDLFAFESFVLRKVECLYLFTRSYFRHGRFTFKSYALLDEEKGRLII